MVGRHLSAARGPAGTLAALALLATLLVAAVPGTFDAIGAADLHHRVDQLAVTQRYLTTRVFTPPPLGPAANGSPAAPPTHGLPTAGLPAAGLPAADADLWGGLDGALAAVVAAAPAPLRRILGAPHYTVVTQPVGLSQPTGTPVPAVLRLALAADPRTAPLITYTRGRAPLPDRNEPTAAAPLEVALSVPSADALGWQVGRTRLLDLGDRSRHPVLLTGVFDAAPDSADHWTLTPSILQPQIIPTPADEIRIGTAYVEADSWPLVEALTGGGTTAVYVPLSVAQLRSVDVRTVLAQLDIFTAAAHPLPGLPDAAPVRLRSGTGAVLTEVLASTATARAVLTVLAIGPCGAALAVFVLGCRLLAARRRPVHLLLAARGWSPVGRRMLLVAEGLLVSAPACLGAAVLVGWLLPPDRPVRLLVAVGAMFVGCPLLLATSPLGHGSTARADLSVRPGRWRVLVEVLVLGSAAASALLLYTTGARGAADGTDPLVVAAPLLLCLAAAVLVTRVYPVPLAMLVRIFHRRRGLTSFLGPARALRSPAGGVAAVLALVVGVAMAVLSGVLLSTLATGITAAARSTVGADLRVDGAALPAATAARVRALPQVRAAATAMDLGPVEVRVSGVAQTVTVYVVDGVGLVSVQDGVTGAVALPPAVVAGGPGLPVVVSADLAAQLAGSSDPSLAVADRQLTVAGTASTAAGVARGSGWIVADRAQLRGLGGDVFAPDELLVALRAGVDERAAAGAVTAAVGSAGSVTTAAAARERLLAAPVIGGVRVVILVALLLMALLGALAVTLLAVDSAPARRRVLGLLQILGLDSSAARALTAWELAPLSVAALLGGGALGAGLAVIVTGAIDLRPFTGGGSAPELTIGAGTTVAVVGGYAAVVVVATLLGTTLAQRISPAVLVRFGE